MIEQSLRALLREIGEGNIVLPAMQRPFVWKEDRIYKLIDSLLREFPIGAIMLWRTTTVQRYRGLPSNIVSGADQIFNFDTSADNKNKYLVLDGQQRLTSLFAAFEGTYNGKRLFIDVLSGVSEGKDPGDQYYDCQFLSQTEAVNLSGINDGGRCHFIPIQDLIKINVLYAQKDAAKKAVELKLNEEETIRIIDTYMRCAAVLTNSKSLHVTTIDEDSSHATPIDEILEIFVRVNSSGLTLSKSDLLMSLLDLKSNDILQELQSVVRDINTSKPFGFTRDDVLKSLLLVEGSETRFDKLVKRRNDVGALAQKLPKYIPIIKEAWLKLGVILQDNCKINCERFLRGGHNSLLPFVYYLSSNPNLSNADRRKIVIGIYLTIMSGIFSGSEARMSSFTRKNIAKATREFPLTKLSALIKRQYGIKTLDDLFHRHLDLALNITHGGITLNGNPDDLQRDHIFPKSFLKKNGYPDEMLNHYANFHFLRGKDNLNKLDKPPHEWFKKPGMNVAPYSDQDLSERLLTWADLQPGQFESMIKIRGAKIRKKAEEIFGLTEEAFNALFEFEQQGGAELEQESVDPSFVNQHPKRIIQKKKDKSEKNKQLKKRRSSLEKSNLEIVEDETEQEPTDRTSWMSIGSKETVELVDQMLVLAHHCDSELELQYNKKNIVFAKNGQSCNFAKFRPKKYFMRFEPKLSFLSETQESLLSAGLAVMSYSGQGGYRIKLRPGDIEKHKEILTTLLVDAYNANGGE